MERGERRLTEAVHARVPGRLCEQVGRVAAEPWMSRSDVLRRAIEEGLPSVVEQPRPGREREDSSGRE